MATPATVRPWTERALIACFLGLLALPLAGKLVPLESALALSENRRLAEFPTIRLGAPGWAWSLVSFPQRFERYWNDTFAFRRHLIRWNSIAKLQLGVSPSPKALVGRDGYLFYAAEQSVDYFRAAKPFTERELARWRDDLEARRAWLAERNTGYLVVVAPNKETIYPEYMPESVRRVGSESRLDQLLAYLRAHSSIDVIDLRPPLVSAKAGERIYHRTDTHWNDAGALVAYRSILARLSTRLPGFDATPRQGTLTRRTAHGGDLARILALEDRFPEEWVEWKPDIAPRARTSRDGLAYDGDVTVTICDGCGGPTIVMNHDSFNTNLAPLLAEHFHRLVLVEGSRLDRTLVERERPAVVIQEFVERALMCPDLRGC